MRRLAFAAWTAVLWLLASAHITGAAPPVIAAEADNFAAVMEAANFAEPLVPTASTTEAEDEALARALAGYEKRPAVDDFSSLTTFLARYPHSGWAPGLLTNLGISYLHYGYFSRAIDAWANAWREGKDAQRPEGKALVDRAVGELARLYASLGQFEALKALFAEIADRPVSGPATEAVQTASEELSLAQKDPRHLLICGPLALRALLLEAGDRPEQVQGLLWYRASANGTNLAEVAHLAAQHGFDYRLIYRSRGEPVPVPAIVHWKVGHFAAVIGKDNGRYRVADPIFPGREIWVTPAALDEEASGYFLVAADAAASVGWRTVGDKEAAGVWGKGPTNGTDTGAAGARDPQADGPDGPTPANSAAEPPTQQPADAGAKAGSGSPGCPLCGYNIGESTVSLTLSDTPVGYTPAFGPSARVRITYNQREDSQPANFSFFNVSAKWTLNWLSYVTDDPTNPGANVSRYLAGGGAYYYSGYSSSTGRFAAQDNDGSILVLTSRTPIIYKRMLRNGGVEVYSQSNGSASFPRNVFLTQVIDPQGNAVTLNYDSLDRVTSLTDAVGRQTTFTYASATGSGW